MNETNINNVYIYICIYFLVSLSIRMGIYTSAVKTDTQLSVPHTCKQHRNHQPICHKRRQNTTTYLLFSYSGKKQSLVIAPKNSFIFVHLKIYRLEKIIVLFLFVGVSNDRIRYTLQY